MTDFNIPPAGEAPIEVDSHLFETWYSMPDEMIGGFVVTNSPKPHHEHDFRQGEVEIASFTTAEMAKHIADLHNRWLERCHRELNWHVSPHRGCILR